MNSMTTRTIRFRSTPLTAAMTMIACIAIGQSCQAASDCDVTVIHAKSVVIEEDKITIVAEASIGMVIITPDFESSDKRPKGSRFTGRLSNWIKIKADEATFTVLREGKGTDRDRPWKMSVDAAEALKAGQEIGRIGYYRPDITIKKNRIHAVVGRGYIYPKRVARKQGAAKTTDDQPTASSPTTNAKPSAKKKNAKSSANKKTDQTRPDKCSTVCS